MNRIPFFDRICRIRARGPLEGRQRPYPQPEPLVDHRLRGPELNRLVGWGLLESIAKQVDEYVRDQSEVHGNKRQVFGNVEEHLPLMC